MKAIFISDAHLRKTDEGPYQAVLGFLDSLLRDGGLIPIDRLYILGDFFDFWFCGKDKIYPGFRPVIDKLIAIQNRGIRIGFCEGNHDFFLDDYFSKVLGMDVFGEWADFEVDGRRFLLSHGDTVDQTNTKHLLLRRFLRSRLSYGLQKVIPASLLWEAARISANISRNISSDREEAIAEKMMAFSMDKFQEGYDVVILGHSHRPILKNDLIVGGRPKTFAALGDWIRHCSYLYYDNGRFRLLFHDRTDAV